MTSIVSSLAKVLAPIAFLAALSGPALATPPTCTTPTVKSESKIGLGFSFAFGAGKVEPSFGVRVFSGNIKGHGAATVGLDYVFSTKRVRPTIGAAILGKNSYVGVDMGIYLDGSGVDFGLGVGGLQTAKASAPVCPT